MAGGDVSSTLAVAVPRADGEALEVAAGDAGDVRRQAGGVAIDVLAVARRRWSACRWWRRRR